MRHVFFLLFTFFSFALFAQEGKILVSGTITDTFGNALVSAHVSDLSSGITTTTDDDGNYLLVIPVKATTIQASYEGMKKQTHKITGDDLKNAKLNTVFISFSLEIKPVQLPTALVTPETKVETFFDPYKAYLFDYTFLGDDLLLLVSENHQRKLLLLDRQKEKLAEQPVSQAVFEFYSDCWDNIHLAGEDSVYQCMFDGKHFRFWDGVLKSDDRFNVLLKNCVESAPPLSFHQRFKDHNQTVVFYLTKADSSISEDVIDQITNKETLQFNEGAYNSILERAGFNPDLVSSVDLNGINQSRDLEQEIWFYQKILSKPVYCPMKKVRDSLYVFDRINDQIHVFNLQGQLLDKRPLKYDDRKKAHLEEILTDHEKTRAFARYLKSGTAVLQQINLGSGTISKTYTLDVHRFPEHIKVMDHYIYYLFKEIDSEDKYKLYRQRME